MVVVQPLSCVWLFVTPWTAAYQASLSSAISRDLLKLMSIESVIPFNYFILYHSLLVLPSISPSSEYSGLISFRMDWLDLLEVQGALKNLLQHHSLKASILQHSLSLLFGPTLTSIHDYWKNHSFDYNELGQQSMFFNMLSRFVTIFLLKSEHFLI